MRPIDADALPITYGWNFEGYTKYDVDNMPTLDMRPNIHAHWIEVDYTFPYKCSACGNHQDLMTNFCWNCGAIMDEEDSNDQR